MTDPFEQAVRDAARELSTPTELPTYHGAYRRGRRRRVGKQAAIGFAGAAVLFAAISVSLGRLPGSGESSEGELAVDVAVATATVPPATTAPLDVDSTETADSAIPPPSPTPGAGASGLAPAPTAGPAPAEPTPTGAPRPVPAPTTAVPAPTPRPQVGPTATPAPVPTATASPAPTARPAPTEPATSDAIPPTATPSTDPGEAALALPPTPTPAGADTPPAIAATGLGPEPRADAVLIEPARTTPIPCDTTLDGTPDALCSLLPDYPCSSAAQAGAGYQAIDLDGDGNVDTCRAVVVTTCDTGGDGLGDTPCIIELKEPLAAGSDLQPAPGG